MARRARPTKLRPPYLRKITLVPERISDWSSYPYCLPLFADRKFELVFERPITIVVGDNGSGKSTLLEAIAALSGFDEAGGSRHHRAVDHSQARESSGAPIAAALRASWLPKVGRGWFFRAETIFAVARYLDSTYPEYADYLSHSHGEGFLRVFEERCKGEGIYVFDEPESALSPRRQIDLLKLLRDASESGAGQYIIATHSPLLMACPGVVLLHLRGGQISPERLSDIDHFRMMREFFAGPEDFVAAMLDE